MRRILAAAFILGFAVSVHAGSNALSCEAQYLKASESLQPASCVTLRRAWATYAAGYADSTDEAVEMLAPLASNLKVDALGRCMQRSLPPPFATLDVVVPDGYQEEYKHAKVMVDGRFINFTDPLGQLTLTVKAGRHIVTAVGHDGFSISNQVDLSGRSDGSVTVAWPGDSFTITESRTGALPRDCKDLHLKMFRSNVAEVLDGSSPTSKVMATPSLDHLDAVLLASSGEVEDVTDLFTYEDHAAVTTRCGEMLARIAHPEPWRLLVAGRDAAGRPTAGERRIWLAGTTLRGRVVVEGATEESLTCPTRLYHSGDPEPFFSQTTNGRFQGDSLPAGDYTIRAVHSIGRDGYIGTQTIRLSGDAPIELRLLKFDRGSSPDPIDQPRLPIVALGFTLDEAGHFVPTHFHRNQFWLNDLPSLSAASLAKMKAALRPDQNYLIAEVVDPQGRVVLRTMSGPQMHMLETEKDFFPDLPRTRAKTLRLTGRLPEQTATFDLTELAKLEPKN